MPQRLTMPVYQIVSADAYERHDGLAEWKARMLEIYDEDPPGVVLHDNAIFYAARRDLGYRAQQQYFMDFGPQFFDGWR